MKRNTEQESINIVCEDIYNLAMKEYHSWSAKNSRLRHCTAWVYNTDNYYILRSYNTPIAVIEKSTGTCVDLLRKVYGYTNTSGQHVAKFRHDYPVVKCYTWR